ncbi:unnamed protein product [Ilex paraguariensis]|uniref:Retrotransposon Copia-like N-terminal domain-containing protein n=1 Tax=Ilex paraguariensis TaxID=185542 RepID=A0ABC8SV51_9AQUA
MVVSIVALLIVSCGVVVVVVDCGTVVCHRGGAVVRGGVAVRRHQPKRDANSLTLSLPPTSTAPTLLNGPMTSVKLNGTNYTLWSCSVQVFLRGNFTYAYEVWKEYFGLEQGTLRLENYYSHVWGVCIDHGFSTNCLALVIPSSHSDGYRGGNGGRGSRMGGRGGHSRPCSCTHSGRGGQSVDFYWDLYEKPSAAANQASYQDDTSVVASIPQLAPLDIGLVIIT